MSNTVTTTHKSIEDLYEEEFSALVFDFVCDIENFEFTDDEYREALEEALAKNKERQS
jgi:hypothetical protein